MLKALFQWLDVHPGSYWVLAVAASVLMVIRIWWVVGQEVRHRIEQSRGSGLDALVLFLFLLAWRWPFLLAANGFNPDESQFIAGAITLAHDPVFWRSVEGATSGPLNFYILVPFAWLGLPLDYFMARLTGLLLVWGALVACYSALAGRFGRAVAWLAVLPAAGFFATVTYYDLIHYSSEHLSLCLIAIAASLLVCREPADRRRLLMASFIAGAAVWAKLQVAPISLAVIGWGFCQVMRQTELSWKLRWRRAGEMAMAALAPTLMAFALIAATGQMAAAVHGYFVQNLLYAGSGRALAEALAEMHVLAMKDGRLPLYLLIALAVLLGATLFFIVRRQRPPGLFAVGGFLSLAALFSVIAPRREFLHYALLLPVPLTLWVGAAVGGWWTSLTSGRARLALALVLFAGAGMPLMITRGMQPRPDMYGQFAHHWSNPRGTAAVLVHALVGKTGSLAVWGWANEIYVESGLPQATRDANSVWSIQANVWQEQHRSRYLDDLRRNAPGVFVDAVGPGAFAYEDRRTEAHETFPELADYIAQNYTQVVDLESARIYAKNGLASLPSMTPERISALMARGRLQEQDRHNTIPPSLTPLDNFQWKQVSQRTVLMLLPPVRVEWLLEEDMRKVSFEFGFEPVAYEQGQSNGAEIILEVTDGEKTEEIFRRFLDPARRTEDRDRQLAVVALPPFKAGARLIVRSDPGPYGDTAWDWVYLASLRFKRL